MLYPSNDTTPIGGEAVQQILLARAFTSLGYKVSMVIRSYEEDKDETIDGIKVLSAFRWDDGIPIIRFFHPRASGMIRALNKVDADIYYQSPASVSTALTAAFCRWRHKKFIFRVASDVDCIPGRQLINFWRDRKLYEYGLRNADLVAVQSRYQQQLLSQHYGLESAVVNMAMQMPEEGLDGERDRDVLWVSNLKPVKRPDRLISVAKRLTDVNFTMIGGAIRGEENYYAEIERQASKLRNVRFLGRVSYREVNQYLAKSKVLLNTSDIEGFPNTFLQAWVRKVPVVSFFDPDEIIVREGLGRRPVTEDAMCSALRELLDDSRTRKQIGATAHSYAVRNFSPIAGARRYIDLCST
jgi:glycosyltransferase involved in cell wall biosynthesis